MADVPSTVLEFVVPAAAGLLYALIWYATRGLPRSAKGGVPRAGDVPT